MEQSHKDTNVRLDLLQEGEAMSDGSSSFRVTATYSMLQKAVEGRIKEKLEVSLEESPFSCSSSLLFHPPTLTLSLSPSLPPSLFPLSPSLPPSLFLSQESLVLAVEAMGVHFDLWQHYFDDFLLHKLRLGGLWDGAISQQIL